MFCSNCGASNPDDGRFCVGCGASLAAARPGVPATSPSAMAPSIPGLAPPYSVPTETSGKAIASLICGLLFFVFPAAVAAIILGHLSLSDIDKSAGRLTGRGMAITGLVFGYGGILFIPFILIIAAIAIPNLLRARIAANESSAAASLRTIEAAAAIYSDQYSNGFPPTLLALDGVRTGGPNCDHAQLIDSVLASGQKSGYVVTYTPVPDLEAQDRTLSAKAAGKGCTVAGTMGFAINADPVTRGTTGMRSFYVDQTAVIRVEQNGPASADSPELGGSQRF